MDIILVSYLTPKERDVAYNQQCDTILKFKNLRLQALVLTHKDKTFQCIRENLVNDFFDTTIKSHRKNHFSDFDKFELCDSLLYHDGLLYVPKGFVRLQIL
jgi:hypothetical protein